MEKQLSRAIYSLSQKHGFPYKDACEHLSIKPVKTRKRCECNYMELLLALSLLGKNNSTIDTAHTLCGDSRFFCHNKQEYLADLVKKSPSTEVIQKVQDNANKFREKYSITSECSVYLTGKAIRFPEIVDITSSLPRKDNKADVFLKRADGTFFGFSVKENKQCTLTNWSIEILEREINKTSSLKTIRETWLKNESAIQRDWSKGLTPMEKQTVRNQYNNMFREINPYKSAIHIFMMSLNEITIIELLAKAVGSAVTNINMIEYVGGKDTYGMRDMSQLYKDMMTTKTARLIPDNAETDPEALPGVKKHYSVNAAKLWYFFELDGVIRYRGESRWKGNCWASMQLFVYKM